MSLIDQFLLRRMLPRILVSVIMFFSMMALVQSLDTHRFDVMMRAGGFPIALLATIIPAARWSVGTLPVTVLAGTIAAISDLQYRSEMTILKASGHSIWRIVRAPVIAVTLFAAVLSIFGETGAVLVSRWLPGQLTEYRTSIWIEQSNNGKPYILFAGSGTMNTPQLRNVMIFESEGDRDRIVADSATLRPGLWQLENGRHFVAGRSPSDFVTLSVPTTTSMGDLKLIITGGTDLTLTELFGVLDGRVSSGGLTSLAMTSMFRAFTLPLTVAGAMLMGFAFMAQYRRRRDYQRAILGGLLSGFALFVLNEMSVRAGNTDVIHPFIAAALPAFISLLGGITALLYFEDGLV